MTTPTLSRVIILALITCALLSLMPDRRAVSIFLRQA